MYYDEDNLTGHSKWCCWKHFALYESQQKDGILVFPTHVGIPQMLTWLPTWNAKSLYHVGTLLPTWLFLPLQKFKTIKRNPEKIPYTQTINGYYIFQGFSNIFSSISALLFIFSKLLTTEKVQSPLSIVAVCHGFFNRYQIQSV